MDQRRSELENLQHELDTRQSELQVRESELRERESRHEEQALKLQYQQEKLEQDRAHLKEQQAALLKSLAELSERQTTWQHREDAIVEQEHALLEERRLLAEQSSTLQKSRTDLATLEEELQTQRASLAQQQSQLREQAASLQIQEEQLQAQRNDLESQSSVLEESRSQLKSLESQILERQEHLARQQAQLDDSLGNHDAERESFALSQADLEKRLSSINSRENDLLSLEEELTAKQAECNRLAEQLRDDREQLAKSQAEWEERQDALAAREQELNAQQASQDQLAAQLKLQAEERQTAAEELELRRRELEQGQTDLNETQQVLTRDRQEFEAAREDLNAREQALAEEKHRLREECDQFLLEQDELRRNLRDLELQRREFEEQRQAQLTSIVSSIPEIALTETTIDEFPLTPLDSTLTITEPANQFLASESQDGPAEYTFLPEYPPTEPHDSLTADALLEYSEEIGDPNQEYPLLAPGEIPAHPVEALTETAVADVEETPETVTPEIADTTESLQFVQEEPCVQEEAGDADFPTLQTDVEELNPVPILHDDADHIGSEHFEVEQPAEPETETSLATAAHAETTSDSLELPHEVASGIEETSGDPETEHEEQTSGKSSELRSMLSEMFGISLPEGEVEPLMETPSDDAPPLAMDQLREIDPDHQIFEDQEAMAALSTVNEPEPVHHTHLEPTPSSDSDTPHSDDDDPNSISNYMERLLARMRNGNPSSEPHSSRPVSAPTTAATRPASKPVPQAPAEEPLPMLQELPPPKKAVNREEVRSGLNSLREIANYSAKSALASYGWKQTRGKFLVTSLLTVGSFIAAAYLLIAEPNSPVGMASIAAFIIMAWQSLQSYWLVRKLNRFAQITPAEARKRSIELAEIDVPTSEAQKEHQKLFNEFLR
ncbi:MAG: hypothetical protein U0903_00215 [Planctomycetales bacterium]